MVYFIFVVQLFAQCSEARLIFDFVGTIHAQALVDKARILL